MWATQPFHHFIASLWKTKKAWQALVLGLQIHFSEEASSQIRNLQIMSMCMWIKIGDNGEENKLGFLSVLSCFKIFINVIKVFFSSSSSSYNKYISRKTIQACVWSPTPSFPPTWLPQPGQWAQRWWEWHLGVSGSQPGLFHDNRGFWNGSNRSREHLKSFLVWRQPRRDSGPLPGAHSIDQFPSGCHHVLSVWQL